MSEKGDKTNLASEFYVLSMFYRLGINAHLTLGNKKSVDIVVENKKGLITIDVKGLTGKTSFLIDNCNKKDKNHFFIFVSFLNRINDPNSIPDVFIVPSLDLEKEHKELSGKTIVYKSPDGNKKRIQYAKLKTLEKKYKNKWDYFLQ